MERCLVSMRIVREIAPIPGADNIELAKIDGWQCVVRKGEFKPSDICVFFEVDSFLPVAPRYEFLRKSSYKKMWDRDGFRIKTVKLRGQLSQGLALPLSLFPELNPFFVGDLAGFLGVIKYEIPVSLSLTGNYLGLFPEFIPKTNQERIQNLWYSDMLDKDCLYEVTVKLNGTSLTAFWKDAHFGVCSRNVELKDSEDNLYWQIAKKYELPELLSGLGGSYAIQGEAIGPGIQGNMEKTDECELYVFDIYNIAEQHYLSPTIRLFHENVLNRLLSKKGQTRLKGVPFVGIVRLSQFKSLDALLEYAEGLSLNPNVEREGVVFRALAPKPDKVNTFKVISNKFLLREE